MKVTKRLRADAIRIATLVACWPERLVRAEVCDLLCTDGIAYDLYWAARSEALWKVLDGMRGRSFTYWDFQLDAEAVEMLQGGWHPREATGPKAPWERQWTA